MAVQAPPVAVRLAWRVVAFSAGIWAIHALFTKLEGLMGVDLSSMYGGHYQFLTNLGLIFSVIAHAFAILSDLAPGNSFIYQTKTVLAIAALPVEALITILYWTIVSISPDLLVPPREVADPLNPGQVLLESVRPPIDIDVAMHALPAVFLTVDHLFLSAPFPKLIRPSLVSAMATLLYCLWIENCASHNDGNFPYPLITALNLPQRLCLYALCSTIMIGVLGLVRFLHAFLDETFDRSWQGSQEQVADEKRGHKKKQK